MYKVTTKLKKKKTDFFFVCGILSKMYQIIKRRYIFYNIERENYLCSHFINGKLIN